jgi:membrane protein
LRLIEKLLLQSARQFHKDGCQQMAAAISYYLLFSLFPLLIFLAGAGGLFLRSESLQQDIVGRVLDFIPLSQDEGRNTVRDAVQSVGGGSGVLSVLGLIGMAWSGSSMFGAIRRALNVVFKESEHTHRPFAQQKLIDLALVGCLGLFFLASIAATAFLRAARHNTEKMAYIGQLANDLGFVWDAASYLLPLAFSFVAFAVVYTVLPAKRKRLRDAWPGALFAALVFELAKFGFSIYLEHFSNYDLVFGSLGAVVAFLFWLYIGANIMLFGAEMTHVYPDLRVAKYEQPAFAALKAPLRQRILLALRGLFVRQEPPATGDREPGREPRV